MRNILLPTDFSENARNTIEYAFGMFGDKKNVSYILLNVYTEPHSSADMLFSIKDLLEKESKRGLKDEHDYLSNKFPNSSLKIEQHSEYGNLLSIINHMVKTKNIDYVVMGTKGASGIKKVLMGSNTADVVKNVDSTILVIPENSNYKPSFRIAFTTDYKKLKNKYVLDPLVELAKKHQSELLVVNIHPEEPIIDTKKTVESIELHHKLENIPHHFYESEHKNFTKGLDYFIQQHKIDLLVMIARQHRFFERLFHNSITEQMSMFTNIPLLVSHEK